MKKRNVIIIGALVVVVLLGFIGYRLLGSLDDIIEAGIEKYGTQITGARVTLDDVVLDLTNGQASLIGLEIGNPQGFQSPHLLKLDEIRLALDINTLTSDPVVIKEIQIQSPDVIYEIVSGGSNVDALLDNVRAYTGGDGGSGAREDSSAPGLVIDDIYIRNGKVSLSHSLLQGKTMSAALPDMHIEDVGRDKGGASAGEVTQVIMDEIRAGANTGVASIKNLPGAVSEQLGKVLDSEKLNSVKSSVSDTIEEAGKKLKGLFQ